MDPVTVTFEIDRWLVGDPLPTSIKYGNSEFGYFEGCFLGPSSPELRQALESLFQATDRV